jgi:hypothetical protein
MQINRRKHEPISPSKYPVTKAKGKWVVGRVFGRKLVSVAKRELLELLP